MGDAKWDAATASIGSKYAPRLASVSAKFVPYTTVPGWRAYTGGAYTLGVQYALTQTIINLASAATAGPAAVASMANDLVDVALHYAETQTAVSGAAKAAITSIEAEAAAVAKDYMAEIVAAAGETSAAAASGTKKSAVAASGTKKPAATPTGAEPSGADPMATIIVITAGETPGVAATSGERSGAAAGARAGAAVLAVFVGVVAVL